MTEIMPVPRNLILLSYQQGAFTQPLLLFRFYFTQPISCTKFQMSLQP